MFADNCCIAVRHDAEIVGATALVMDTMPLEKLIKHYDLCQ